MRKLEEKTGGGLFVPTADTEKPKEGFVVAAGPGAVHPETGALIECPVKEGDLVMVSDYTGETVEYNGEKHVFVDADSLLGVFADKSLTAQSFTPICNRVLVAVAESAKETTTGIALALDEDEDDNTGEVVSVGPGKRAANGQLREVDIKPGENVMYKKYSGAEAALDGKRFKIVFESDCLAKW